MKNIIIYGEQDNVFCLSLRDLVQEITLLSLEAELHSALTTCLTNTVVILINKRELEAIRLKSQFPQLDIFLGHGGEKNFSPQVKIIDIGGNHQYLHFTSWSELIDKLNDETSWLKPGLLTIKGGNDLYQFAPHVQSASLSRLDPKFFFLFLYFAYSEIQWLSEWLHFSSKIKLTILNKLPKKVTRRKKITIQCNNFFKGLEVCQVDDIITFYQKVESYYTWQGPQYTKELVRARVISVTEKTIEIEFGQPIDISRLLEKKVFFCRTKSIQSALFRGYRNFLKQFDYRDSNLYDGPIRFWQAEDLLPKSRTYLPISNIRLSGSTKNILSDSGQVRALHEMLNERSISLIQGGPGSGKTFITAVAVAQLVRAGRNVLVVAHSNKALDVLLREIISHVPEKKVFRLGNNYKSITDEKVKKRHRIFRESEHHDLLSIRKLTKENKGVVLGVTANSFIFDWLLKNLLSQANAANDHPMILDWAFIDEASKVNFLELLVIAQKTDKLVLIGDDDQLSKIPLPGSVSNHILQQAQNQLSNQKLDFASFAGENKGLSFYATLEEIEKWHKLYSQGDLLSAFKQAGLPTAPLKFNRRSLPLINQMINNVFAKDLIPGRFNYQVTGRVTLLKVVGQEKLNRHSFYNPKEAKIVESELLKFYKKQEKKGEIKLFSVVVICSYKAQVDFIKQKLRKFFLYHQVFQGHINPDNIDETLNRLVVTVDAYQGDQNDLVIITLTRSNEESRIGFLQDLKRLYVAATRAKDEIIFITNHDALVNSDHAGVQEFAQKLALFCKQQGTLVTK